MNFCPKDHYIKDSLVYDKDHEICPVYNAKSSTCEDEEKWGKKPSYVLNKMYQERERSTDGDILKLENIINCIVDFLDEQWERNKK